MNMVIFAVIMPVVVLVILGFIYQTKPAFPGAELAIFSFFAMPPTIIPMLKVETRVRSQLPRNAAGLPGSLTPQNTAAMGKTRATPFRGRSTRSWSSP